MRLAISQPWSGVVARVRRMRRSSVPCSRSLRTLSMEAGSYCHDSTGTSFLLSKVDIMRNFGPSGLLGRRGFYPFNEEPESEAHFIEAHRHHVTHADDAQGWEDDDGEGAQREKQRCEDSQKGQSFRDVARPQEQEGEDR